MALHTVLSGKIHRVTVTQCELHYEGSCAIDEDLLDASGLHEFERIDIWNVNNGERFSTYIIKGARGSGMISVNGSAARRASVGDLLIIAGFIQIDHRELATHQPRVVFVDANNRPVQTRQGVPTQAAPLFDLKQALNKPQPSSPRP